MKLIDKLRAGEGPFWGFARRCAKRALSLHLPVNAVTRPVFRSLYAVHVFVRDSWIALKRFWWCEPLFRSQCRNMGERFQMEDLPYLTGQGVIRIGDGVRLSGKSGITFCTRVEPEPELAIGDDTFVGHDCGFSVARSIVIGRHCLIAGGTTLRDYDGHPLDAEARRNGEFVGADEVRAIRVGDDVWIGAGSQILKGVTIGDRSVVAAGSVVTRDVSCDVVVGGCPARVLRELDPQDAESRAELAAALDQATPNPLGGPVSAGAS